MSPWMILAAAAFPALNALLLGGGRSLRPLALAVSPWGALPALLAALILTITGETVEPGAFPLLLVGVLIQVDPVGRAFLLVTALVWTAAGVHARGKIPDPTERSRFFLFHGLALTGNLGVVVSGDPAGFYLSFALMTFAAYGLVVHDRTPEALRAGRIYIGMAVVGEAFLLSGILMAVSAGEGLDLAAAAGGSAVSPQQGWILLCLLVGFGIKAGAIPLHMWLPLAHPLAPTPASAALSGAMIKAGLLGWIRFLPLGAVALPVWGFGLVGAGLAAIFLGALAGTFQRDAKAALAYSSISQMGFPTVLVGVALISPEGAPAAVAAATLYALHHGLAKGALFLGVGAAEASGGGRLGLPVRLGLVAVALALAGAPFTSGMAAKGILKETLEGGWSLAPAWLEGVLSLGAAGTTLVMLRFLSLVWPAGRAAAREGSMASSILGSWLLLTGAVLIVPPLLTGVLPEAGFSSPVPGFAYLWAALWPVALGFGLAALWALTGRRSGRPLPHLPPGDLLVPLERLVSGLPPFRGEMPSAPDPVETLASRWYGLYSRAQGGERILRGEIELTRWELAAVATVGMVLLVFILLAVGAG